MSSTSSQIGSGSYSTVTVKGSVAYKTFTRDFVGGKREFEALKVIYTRCSPGAVFFVLKPIAFCEQDNDIEAAFENEVIRPAVGTYLEDTKSPTIPMERISDIPDALKAELGELLGVKPDEAAKIRICLLGIGRNDAESASKSTVNLTNVLLTADMYTKLAVQSKTIHLPPIEQIASGIGEMVSRIHWKAGYDANDIKFVMGGNGNGGIKLYVIDFNLVRTIIFFYLEGIH
ncbi:hypothetical protein NEOLEDRAFT_1142100 [Neolentinus lepideus HHB14362 ss-1]|uniref:Uncharacterized protein n=1 Tax=Neolentinus lepideus HHB14362 ss-1 TaxID=1314782 RepID=A0A165NBH2_9AGAM|nr:hypothetical protein NEOLEDRAFT_1142100 [Neolentinus lepideus HHB14362 ss-1]